MAGAASVRIALADDKVQTRHAPQALLSTYEEIEVVAGGSDGTHAVALAEQHHPDVVPRLSRIVQKGSSVTGVHREVA